MAARIRLAAGLFILFFAASAAISYRQIRMIHSPTLELSDALKAEGDIEAAVGRMRADLRDFHLALLGVIQERRPLSLGSLRITEERFAAFAGRAGGLTMTPELQRHIREISAGFADLRRLAETLVDSAAGYHAARESYNSALDSLQAVLRSHGLNVAVPAAAAPPAASFAALRGWLNFMARASGAWRPDFERFDEDIEQSGLLFHFEIGPALNALRERGRELSRAALRFEDSLQRYAVRQPEIESYLGREIHPLTHAGIVSAARGIGAAVGDAGTVVVILSLLGMAAGAFFAWALAAQIRRRMRDLRRETEILAAGVARFRIPVSGADEFGELAEVFNRMLSRVEQSAKLLAEKERELETVLKTAPSSILTTDDQGQIESFNAAAQLSFGYTLEEIRGRAVTRLIAEAEQAPPREFLAGLIARRAEGDAAPAAEYQGIRKDGSRFALELCIGAAQLGGRSLYTLVLHDISAGKQAEARRRELEAQLRHAQKLETIGTMAGGIAHDFNNILTSIFGFLALAMEDIPPGMPARGSLEEVLRAAARAKDLVGRILTFSRLDEQEKRPVRMRRIVGDALKLLRATLPSTIEIRQDIRTGGAVHADSTQMHQVIMNLCANSYHAMREHGGMLEVALETVTLDGKSAPLWPQLAAGSCVRLTVRDNGCGMDPATLERACEPFFTTKPVGEGTGLGLAVVHGIVTGHGGRITLSSSPGRGTIAEVYLPQIEMQDSDEDTLVQAAARAGHERILFVDDETSIAVSSKALLERLGYQVTIATSASQAFDLFAAGPDQFDLVVTDQTMPQTTGIQLARRMMALKPGLPVILTTGYCDLVSRESCLKLGLRGYLKKPFAVYEVSEAIRGILDDAPAAIERQGLSAAVEIGEPARNRGNIKHFP